MADNQESTVQTVTSETLADFNAEKLNLSKEPQAEVKLDEPKAEETETEIEHETEQTEEQEKKGNPKLQKRFSELTQQREQARQEAATLKAENEALQAKLKQFDTSAPKEENNSVQVDSDRPKADDYLDSNGNVTLEYAEKLAIWAGKQALVERDAKEQKDKAEQAQNKVVNEWAERLNTFKKDIPDFDDMVNSSDIAVSDQIRDAILESDVGPQVLYHLATNTDEAKNLQNMPLASALRYIGRLEAKYETAPTEKVVKEVSVSKAPAPISPIRSGKTVPEAKLDSNGEFTGTFEEFKKFRQAGKIN